MSKRAARLFFLISTLVSALIFTILTIDSHRQFPRLTNAVRERKSLSPQRNRRKQTHAQTH